AKEKLFADLKVPIAPITVLGRGSKVIGGTIRGELARNDVEQVLVEGFFPECLPTAEPKRQRGVGLQELGVPYAADPAVTRHLAAFIQRNAEQIAERAPAKRGKKKATQPTAVMFNGGVFKAAPLRERLLAVLNKWVTASGAKPVKELQGTDLDLAVARGAAYYG